MYHIVLDYICKCNTLSPRANQRIKSLKLRNVAKDQNIYLIKILYNYLIVRYKKAHNLFNI